MAAPSAETIQDIVNALSIIPTYVRELERQNSLLQKSSDITAIRLLQLEKEYVQMIRSNLAISNCWLIRYHVRLLEVRNSQGSAQ